MALTIMAITLTIVWHSGLFSNPRVIIALLIIWVIKPLWVGNDKCYKSTHGNNNDGNHFLRNYYAEIFFPLAF